MKAIPAVRSSAFRPIVDGLRGLGLPAEPHLESVGVPLEVIAEPDLIVPERALWALLESVREREGIEDIGFQIGASHHVSDVGNLRALLGGRPTLLSTLHAFCELLTSHASYWDYWLERASGGILLCRRASPIDIGKRVIEQYVVAYLVDLVRGAAGPEWKPQEIWLQIDCRLSPSESDWLQETRLHFGNQVTKIFIPRELLGLNPRISETSASMTSTASIPHGIVPILRAVLQAYLPYACLTLGELSEILGMSPRTVQRHLTSAGTSFQRVLDEVRLKDACRRLVTEQQCVTEIGLDLGYQEVAAFSKAFRRWAGVSPSTYRKANRERLSTVTEN